jgi:hypothetical protein
MESLQDRSSASGDGSPAEPSRSGKLERIAGHTRGLFDDLREWIDLRLDLAILEIEEQVDELRNEVALGLTLAFLGFFAALFVFTTVALGLGWLLGHPFWGFLIVSGTLLLIFVVLAKTRPIIAPPSNLYERIRGDDDGESDRPVRETDAEVTDDADEPATS